MKFKLSAVLALISSTYAQVNVVEMAKELFPAAESHKHNHNEDHLVNLLVQVKNQDGKHFASKLAESVRVERPGLKWMGIVAKHSKIKELEENENIVGVDIDHEEHALETEFSVRRRLTETIPWGIPTVLQDIDFWKNLDAPQSSISVCVVDTGYDLGHEDLPSGADVDGTDGAGEAWSYDGNSHGTHCAGTIAALGNNDIGVTSVIPDNQDGNFMLLIGKAFGANGSGYTSQTIAAVQGCVDQGANVISMSLGGSGSSRSSRNFYQDLYENQNILLIAAAGNSGNSAYSYPASYDQVMSVASLQERRSGALQRSSFSQFNDQVEISAPGSSVLSTIPGNAYGYKSGTSMATPHVSGVAGLLWSYFPDCTNAQIRHVLDATASTFNGDCNDEYGFGLVQAKDAYDLLAEGNCGGDLGPEANAAMGGCDELGDFTGTPTGSPTSGPTSNCGVPGDSCGSNSDCCSGLCRNRAKTCR